MLQIKNLSKSYGAKKAVSNLSFVVEDGDIMGFIGKNGAGKTTTLKACLGIIGIDEGEILLDGTSVLKEQLACKQKMAYVPDNPQLDEYMTGLQYINFICDIYEVPSKMRKQNFEKLALAFQMGPHLNNLISSYSHGMKQKLALIAAFSHTPKLLILDEPFVGLDPEAFVILKEQIKELCASGNSVLFSSHMLGYAFPLLCSVLIGMIGYILNLIFPNFEWENVTHIIKQSLPAILTALIGVVVTCGTAYLLLRFFPSSLFIGSWIACAIILLLFLAMVTWVDKKGQYLYYKV